MRKKLFCSLIFLLNIQMVSTAQAETLIEVALHAKPSIVEVQAQHIELYKAPQNGKKIYSKQQTRRGAGVIIDTNGTIITNLHTIFETQKITVKLSDGSLFLAKILKLMPGFDMALLKINSDRKLKPLTLADSDHLALGEDILHIGNSYLLKGTISSGRIIGLARPSKTSMPDEIEFIKINMSLYKGDSGGAVLNTRGQLVGMIEARFVSQEKLTLVIPSNKIRKFYQQSIEPN